MRGKEDVTEKYYINKIGSPVLLADGNVFSKK